MLIKELKPPLAEEPSGPSLFVCGDFYESLVAKVPNFFDDLLFIV